MTTISIDLGGTNLRSALVKNNKIIKQINKKTSKDRKTLIEDIEKSIQELIQEDTEKICIACPGLLENTLIKKSGNIPLENYDLNNLKRNNLPLYVENDANCVALAELIIGCQKDNFIVLTFGTGIGGGIIINKQLYKGQGNAAELGHIIINNMFFEKVWQGRTANVKDLPSEELDTLTEYIGQGIASLINVFDPEIVVLSGGFRDCGDSLLEKIRNKVKKHSIIYHETPIEWSYLDEPGILGASLLPKH